MLQLGKSTVYSISMVMFNSYVSLPEGFFNTTLQLGLTNQH